MRRNIRRGRAHVTGLVAAVILAPGMIGLVAAQGGDQFLDGIGETALVARYLFNGNAEDSSRNQFHAALRGSGAVFVEDARFGRVLLLTGDGSHVQLPADALAGEDTISVTGWLYLPTGASGPVFDFGQSASTRLFAVVRRGQGFRARLRRRAGARRDGTASRLPENQWVHFAVVLDPGEPRADDLPRRRAGRPGDQRRRNAAQLDRPGLGRREPPLPRPLAGRRRPTLHGRLRDVRIYRIALTDAQVATIRPTRVGRQSGAGRGAAAAPVISTATIPKESPLASRLDRGPRHQGRNDRRQAAAAAARDPGRVPRQGHGPDGPRDLAVADRQQPGGRARHLHRDGQGPRHARSSRRPRSSSRPAGQRRRRRCDSSRRSRSAGSCSTATRRGATRRSSGTATSSSAASPRPIPTASSTTSGTRSGSRSPQGAKQLDGWDNQTTRLRGHASGHYLTAIAQAYASTTYDEALRANFLQKMNYLIDTLYDLSQKSGRPATEGGPFDRRSDGGAAGAGPHRLRLESPGRRDPHRLLELGHGLHQRVSARPVHHAREGRHLRHAGHARSGRRTTRCTRSSPACSTATRSAATRRRSRSRGAWARGCTRG